MEVLCLFDDGSELVMKTDANGELKGLAKGIKSNLTLGEPLVIFVGGNPS